MNAGSCAQDWFQGVGLLTFLRDVGKYARVGTMLSRDAVKSRMELDNEGISYTEWVISADMQTSSIHVAHISEGLQFCCSDASGADSACTD